MPCRGTQGSTGVGRERGDSIAFIVVSVEGMGEAGEVGLALARLNHFSGLRGMGPVTGCLVTWLRAGGEWPSVWELIEEVAGVWTDWFAFEKRVLGIG